MTIPPISRRGFFGQAVAGATLGQVNSPPPPRKAWTIVALGWEYNDEFTYQAGEYPRDDIYFDRAAADAECQRLCDEFFAAQTPEEFELDWDSYRDGLPEERADADDLTWDELREAGFADPYYVLELTHPGATTP